jgi:hypothetical protein
METKFLIIGIHQNRPFEKEFRSPASLGQYLAKLMERGEIGDKLSVEVIADDLPEASAPFTGTLSNPYFPEE